MKKLLFIAILFACGCSKNDSSQQSHSQPQITLFRTSIQFDGAGGENTLEVESNAAWSASLPVAANSSWLAFSPNGAGSGKTTVRVTASANNTGNSRSATISFVNGSLARSLTVTQAASRPENTYSDGEVVKLQSASTATGRGIELVVMGDGYTISDMAKGGGGKYETDMRAAAEHFFSTYPFDVNRGRFNVWMVVAISNESGIGVSNPAVAVDNKFKSVWEGGESTGIDSDATIVDRYASIAASHAGKYFSELTVIMPINANITAGTCEMRFDGFSYAMCPVGPLFKNIVVHESGGHGFAKLGDEYAYNETIPANAIEYVRSSKAQYGFYANLDFSSDITRTSWSGFAGNPKYSMVATFEGGYTYRRGIWRPEQNSSMGDGALYFNAPSRWAQVKRMYELEGTSYTFEQFLADDVVPAYPTTRSGADGAGAGQPEAPGPLLRTAPPIVVLP